MEDYPFTTNEFEKRFSDEKACRDYLFQLRWPDSFQCPRCENNKAWLNNRLLYQCSKCNFQETFKKLEKFGHRIRKPTEKNERH